MVTTLGFVGTVSAATPAVQHIKPGGVWTNETNGAGCAIDTFGPGHTWTADLYGDSGTYTGGRNNVTLTYTAGNDAPATFSGTFSKSKKEYSGSYGGKGAGFTGQLVKGRVAKWKGNKC